MKVSGTSCLLLGLLATLVHAQNEAVCASSCRFTGDGRPGVHFVPGHTYQFQYQGEAVTSAKVTEGQESRFSVKAAVSISARNPCDLKMEVSEIGVEGIPDDQIAGFVASVQTYDLHFSYQDGEIEYLCPHEKEDPAATNFKRGVLSALQTTVTKVDDQTEVVVKEIDVGGDCETRYSIQNTGKLTVTKKKENCRSTAHFPYIPHVRQASYSSSGDLPFFRRTQSCQLILGDAVWERVECTEELQVEGSTSSLASVLLTSRLELQDVLGARSDIQEGFFSLDEPLTRKESLRMDLDSSASLAEPQGDQDALKAQLEQTLEYLVASLKDAKLQEGRPFAFAGLVSLMGRLEDDQLERLWDDYRSKSDYREFFLDGLTSCERERCVRLVAALAQEDTAALPDSRLKTWLAGVHFHAHADPLSLQHVMDLANSYTDVPSSVLLAASSMVHRLCRDDPLQCRSQAQPFLAYVEEKVGDTCGYGETRDRQREVMVVLRALGNAGLLPFEAFPEKCYLNRALASDVRTAALQTYRRLGCVRTDSPWQILEDEYDSVEVRIKAYLALVSCASETPGFFSRIEKVLDRETVHQVGSFIWTHVRNLAEEPGVSEYDQELAKLASHPTLNSKFNTNPLRSSRNYRYAHFSEILNGGGSLDSNVIFSDSYVPRHASVNLTVDILQNSFNVLEIGGDFVALEEYVDRILGREASKDQIEKEKILKLQRLYDEARTVNELTGLDDHESRASVFFRVFGHEVVYLDNVLNINPLETLQQLVSEFTVPKSFQLLNQECVSPTLLGFPLRLKVNATGSLVLTRDGTFEMTGHGVMLEGHLNPSAVVAVEETLAVDGFGFLSGIRRRTTQTSHMQLGLKVEVVKGELVDVQLNMPEEEIAQVKSSVQVGLYDNAQGGWKELQEPEEADGEGPCTPDTFNKVVGLKFCANRGLVITRTDTFDHYKFSFENRDGKAKVLFDTPGSSMDRQFSLEVNTNPENFGGSLVFPGKRYDLKGEAVSTQRRKRFKMKYLEDSNTKGELDLLINRRDEGFKVSYTSGAKLKLKGIGDFSLNGKLAVGDDALSVEGTLISSLQYEPIAFKASWERDGDQHSLEGLFAAGQLGSATGSASVAPSSVKAQLKGDYSYDRPEPHTFSVTLDLANKSGGRGMYKGHVTATSTQAEVNLDVSYLYQENLLEFMADTAVLGKETKAQLVLRNVATEADRDVQLSASFACPQLDVDYSADFIYLSTPTALRLESGVGLGSLVQAKGAFTYAFEEEPFRALAGVHLELNGRGAKAAFDFDLSQSHRALGLVSVSVGSASSELRVDLQYDPSRPLNVTLEALGGNDPMTSSGVTLHTSSDPSWTVFQGNARVKWQEWSSSISHNVTWLPDSKAIQVILGDAHVMEVKAETAPDLLFSVLLSSDQASAEPEFQAGIQRVQSPVQTDFKLYLTSGTDKLLRFTAVVGSNQTFGGNFRLLESQLEVIGSYEHPYAGDLQGTAAVRMVLPSGQTYSSDLALNHTYDGVTRNLMVSSTYGDDMLKGHMTIKQEDGWFSEPVLAFALSLSTPFTRLGNVGFAMESRGDSSPSSAEFQWDELKVRAEAQLEDLSQLEVKFLYEDGGTCDSHFHLYNKYRDGHYMTGISLDLTASYDPWMVEVNTTLGYGTSDLMINVGAPVLSSPYQAHLSYELTSTIFEFDAQIGMAEGESAAVTFSGQREAGWDSVMRSGSLMVDTPWTEPLVLNITNYQESDLIHVSVDLTSTLGGINSVRSEFGIYYTKPGETQLQFNVTHEQLVIELELNNKHSRKGYTQQLKGTVNDIEITYALETEWDHSFIPETADGQIAITNLLDHNLNLTVSHNRNSSTFSTKIFGSWGDQLLQASHILEFQNLLDWSSVANIVLPSKEEIKSELSLSAEADFSSFQSNLNFTSPWTDNIVTVATAVPEDSSIMYELISIHRDSVISRATLRSSRAFGWDHSDFMLDVSSTYFENCSIAWEHGVDYGNLIFMEATYGSDFLIQATSNLTFSQGWFSQEFSEYLLLAEVRAPVQGINFKANLHFDSQYNGNVEALWDGSSVMAKSAIFDGVIFKTLVDIPDHKYQADLEYTEGINEIPNFDFKLAVKDEEILIVNTTTTSLYPKLDVQLTFQVLTTPGALMQTGMLNVTMDLSQVEDFTFLGSVRFLSDFAGFENYGLHVETNVNLNPDSWDVGFDIKLFANEETYNLSTSASLALDDLPHLKYEMAYDMNFNDQLLDQKEVNFMFGIPQYGSYQTNVTLVLASDIPQWALFMSYNNTGKDIKGYVIPGDENKYEVAASLNTDNLVFNSQRVGDDGSTFIAAEGKITWDVDSPRKQITLTMNSDIEAVKEVSGEILITESRGFEVSANFMLNQQKFTANLRYEARGSGTSGRAVLEVENTIFLEFKFEANFEFFFTDEEFKADLKINVNDDAYFIKSHMKASLEESYIRIEMPIEDWENIDLTVNIMPEESYRVVIKMKVPKFCFNFDGKLDQLFLNASVNINIQENCSATAIFEFNMKYEVKDNLISVFSDCYIQGIGIFFTIEGECKIAVNEYEVTIKSEFYPEYSLGLQFSWLFKEDEFGLKLHVYEISTDTTYFLFSSSFSFLRSEITFKILEEQKLELKAEYDIQPTQAILEASYDHSLFGHSLSGKLTGEANYKENYGDIEIHFSTDSAFGQADLEVNYDLRKEVKVGNFKLTTSNGNADGKLQLQMSDQELRLTFDMSSSLHSFEKYHFDAQFENKINGNTLRIYSSQDDMKYNFTSSVSTNEDDFTGGITLHMPFQILEMFEVGVSLPLSEVPERKYVAMVSGVTAGEYYGVGVKHNHHENWKQQKIELDFTTPEKTFSNFTAFMEYDFDGKAALYVNGTRGCLGLKTNWKNSDALFAFDVHSYLTLLGLGEHLVSADIPLHISQRGEVRFMAQKTDYDFTAALITGENFKYGNVTLMILPEAEEPKKRIYDLNYEYDNQFYLNGQFDEWRVSTRWDFTGDQIPASSGNIRIQTNFPEYELIDGYWEIHQKDSIHSLQFKVDMKQKGVIFLSSGFDNHPRGTSAPWKGVKLDLLFDSPFTLTHTLRAQYQTNPLRASATYKHGFDTFQVDFTTNFQNNEGTVGLTGNIPVPGISVFKVDFKYKFSDKSQNVVKFKAKIEETILAVNGKAKMDWSNGIVEATVASPFFSPGRAEFEWSTEKTRVTYWAMLEYKQQEIKAKMALEQTSRLVKLDIFVSTPFEGWKNMKVHIGYSWLPSAFTFTSVLTKEEMQIYNIKSSFLFSDEKVAFSIEGTFEPLKTSGLLMFEFSSTENAYEIKFQEQLNEYEVLEFHFELDEYHLESRLNYGTLKILEMSFNYYKAEVFFTWDKGQYFNIKANHSSTNDGREFNFSLKISDNRPVTVQITYSSADGQKVTMILAFGDRKYKLTGKLNVDNRQLLISVIFESSEDVENPVTIEAMFDLYDFARGKMKAVKDLARISLDWGGKMELSLSGMRQKNAIKLTMDITTPYEILPKLNLSFEVGQKRKQNSLDVKYQLSCEWSEKVELSGSLKYKSDDFLLKNEIQTTFPVVENLNSKLLLKPKYFEIATDLNGDEWKLSIREYSFSLPFSLKVDIKTPLEGYESLSLTNSVKLKNGELEAEITFNWPEEKLITLKIQAEMWNLKVKLNTPWTPLREVIFIASLRTESEEVSAKVTLQWDGSKVEMTSDVTPKDARIVGKYNSGETEVASVRVEYIIKGSNFEFGVVVETMYDALKLFRTNFQLGPQGISLEVLINEVMSRFKGSYSEGAIKFILDIPFLYNFQWNLEAKQDWTKLDTYSTMTYPKGSTPYNITLSYALQTSSLMVMFDVAGDVKIMSFGIDVSDIWKFSIAYFGSQMETTINPNVNDVMNLKFESTDLSLEQVTLDVSVDYGEYINISSIMTTGFRNMNVSSHIMNVAYTTQEESFVFGAVLTSSYIDGSYKLDTIIPLRNILVEKGKAVVSLFVGEQKYIVSYVHDNLDDMTFSRSLRIEFPDWTADFSTNVTDDSITIVFSYPEPSTKHELVIMWPEPSGAENILLAAELNSPHLGDDPAKYDLKFVVLDELHFTVDSEFSHGTKKIDIEGELQYNDDLREITYNTKIRSDWIGDYAVDVIIQWLKNIALDATLKIHGERHNLNLIIDPDTHEASAKASSSWIPYENVEFMGSLGKDLTPSNMNVEGKLSLGDGEILVEGRFQNNGMESLKSHVNITRNMKEMFSAELDFGNDGREVTLSFIVTSVVPEINTSVNANYENYGSKNLRVDARGFLALYNHLIVDIDIGETWYDNLRVYLYIKELMYLNYSLLLIDRDFSTVFDFSSGKTLIRVTADYNISVENHFTMKIDNSVLPLENVHFRMPWPVTFEETQIHISFVYDAEYAMFDVSADKDWDCLATVITPFRGYEKFVFKFLFSTDNTPAFVAMVEYPGGKLGIEAVYRSLYDAKFVVSLPLEKYDIIAFQLSLVNGEHWIAEARVGKVGFTVSFRTLYQFPFTCFEIVLRLNEMSIQGCITERHSAKRSGVEIHLDFESIDVINIHTLDMKLVRVVSEMDIFIFKTDLEELIKLQIAEGKENIFALTTPKSLPIFLVVNLQNSEKVNECRVKVGMYDPVANLENYGFHVRQESLEGGHHFSLSGDVPENNFYAEGTLSLNYYHLNESLVFELNKNRIGYRSTFQVHPGIFKDEYTGDVEVMLPAQIVHWNMSAICGSSDVALQSRFTWNELAEEVEAMNFMVNYNDNTIFGQGEHHMKVVFMHPDIKDIVFEGNVTQYEDFTVSGMAEFLDENIPEMNITLAFDMHPAMDDGKLHFTGNISQLSSGFLAMIDTRVLNTPSVRQGDYSVKYWSLTKESWEELRLSTALNTTEEAYDFAVDISTSDDVWGYAYRGGIYSWEESGAFLLGGSSKKYQDFWEIESRINKYMPEFNLQLGVGQGKHEPYEQRRLRLGLHNPLEMGAVLDHRKFGEWRQDGIIGLRLKAQHMLQFVLEYDPSLDSMDDYFLKNLISPADRISGMWWRDLSATPQAVQDWVLAEGPTAIEVLVNKPILFKLLEKEGEKLMMLISDVDATFADISLQAVTIWTSVIEPSLDITYSYGSAIYAQTSEALSGFFEILTQQVGDYASQLTMLAMDEWAKVEEGFWIIYNQCAALGAELTTQVLEVFTAVSDAMVTGWTTCLEVTQAVLSSVQAVSEPVFMVLFETFAKYIEDLGAVLGGQCGQELSSRFAEMVASLEQDVGGGASVVLEFLQPEEYTRRLQLLWDGLAAWTRDTAGALQDAAAQAGSALGNGEAAQVVASLVRLLDDALAQVQDEGLLAIIQKRTDDLRTAAVTLVDEVLRFSKEGLEALSQSSLLRTSFLRSLHEAAEILYENVDTTWRKGRAGLEMELEGVQKTLYLFGFKVREYLERKNYLLNEILIYQPYEYGRIRYSQFLPVPWRSFLDSPDWSALSRLFLKESPAAKAERLLELGMLELDSVWRPLPPPGVLVPLRTAPRFFTATATVMGQHVTTFDLHHYEFLGPCSYLLTKDFIDGDFEVVGVYESEAGEVRLESVLIRAPGTDVTLRVDGTVDVTYAAAKVESAGGRAELRTNDLEVICSHEFQGCSITVTSKYFGRLGGMLGNFNYEPSDDQQGPDGARVGSVGGLARLWAVSTQACYQANQATRVLALDGAAGVDECQRLFLGANSSPFATCFSSVDPRPYFWHCVNDRNRPVQRQGAGERSCDAAESYRVMCATEGRPLPVLDACLGRGTSEDPSEDQVSPSDSPTCSTPDGEVPVGWSRDFWGAKNGSLDVGLVVEQASCNEGKDFGQMLREVAKSFRKAGYQDVRFALLTYTSSEVGSASAFSSEGRVASLLEGAAMEDSKDARGGSAAVMKAARTMQWRPAVGRLLLQASCQLCDDGEDVAEALRENDVVLHVLSRLTVTLEGPETAESKTLAWRIFGYDKDLVYTSSDYRTFQGDAGQRELLEEHGESCLDTVQDVGGAVFNSNRWIPKKAGLTRKFLSVLSQRLATDVPEPRCHQCRCLADEDQARLSCRRCGEEPEINPVMEKIIDDFRAEFHTDESPLA